MSAKLLPCPFCGEEVGVLSDTPRTWGIVKHRDGCFFSNFCFHVIQEYEFEAWNRRHVETCRMIYDEEASGDELWPTEAYHCSECGKWVYAGKPNYCPNCGRKVEG